MSLSTVTSEALQLKLRQLLPSQQGFGTDLSASDTIIPIIDLTAAAEGSDVRESLQNAIAFGSQTVFSVINTTSTIVTGTGFFRILGVASIKDTNGAQNAFITLSDGAATKDVWQVSSNSTSSNNGISSTQFDIIVFLRTGDTVTATATSSGLVAGSGRQIADINGVLVQPVGFTPQ